MSDVFGDQMPFGNRDPLQGAIEAGLLDSAVESFEVPDPTEESLAEHRAIVASIVGLVAIKIPRRTGINWAAVKAGIKGRVTL